jgi:hypothetical protein
LGVVLDAGFLFRKDRDGGKECLQAYFKQKKIEDFKISQDRFGIKKIRTHSLRSSFFPLIEIWN